MDKTKSDNNQNYFTFNLNALEQSSGSHALPAHFPSSSNFTRYNEQGFHQKFNYDTDIEIKRKRGRKKKALTSFSN